LRYSLADVVAKRVTKAAPFGGDLLTDDFAPADAVITAQGVGASPSATLAEFIAAYAG
jgi:hypothetical protein